jgi:hypothetical protein
MGPNRGQRSHVKLDLSPLSISIAGDYHEPRPTAATTPDVLSPPHGRDLRTVSGLQSRFVAGATFFNYNAYGSLRSDHEPIQLLSRGYIGLAIHFLVSGFVFFFFSYGYGRLLADHLKANSEQQVYAAYYVLVWPSALSIFFGLVSDGYPICGHRRKAYMVLGWLISVAMYFAIFFLHYSSDKGGRVGVIYLFVSLIAACGIQISWLAGIAASVEYAQRELIHYRGRLQASLLALYYAGGALARFLIAILGNDNGDQFLSSLSMGGAAVVLGVVTLVAIPLVIWLFGEEPSTINVPQHVDMPLRERLQTFWKFCHQNVVYHVLFFTTFHLLLLGLFSENVRGAVEVWSSADPNTYLSLEGWRLATNVVSVLMWKFYLRNVSWRTLVIFGSLLYMLAYAVVTVFATFNVVRSKAFYTAMILVSEVPRAGLTLFTFVLATEVADMGHEGVTVALAMSYQMLAGLADFTLATIAPNVLGYNVTDAEIAADASSTRTKVIKAYAVMTAINVLCFPAIKLLPQQKLDAQQQRAFGGYNAYASHALLATFAVLLCFNLAVNLMAVI